jgi:hypothetical protein
MIATGAIRNRMATIADETHFMPTILAKIEREANPMLVAFYLYRKNRKADAITDQLEDRVQNAQAQERQNVWVIS